MTERVSERRTNYRERRGALKVAFQHAREFTHATGLQTMLGLSQSQLDLFTLSFAKYNLLDVAREIESMRRNVLEPTVSKIPVTGRLTINRVKTQERVNRESAQKVEEMWQRKAGAMNKGAREAGGMSIDYLARVLHMKYMDWMRERSREPSSLVRSVGETLDGLYFPIK